jgi:PAS domain S-box-containing protein
MADIEGLGTVPDPTDELGVLRRLVNHLPAMVAFWDAAACNVVANGAYLEWFGWTPERLRGRHISELLGPELYAMNLPYITAALAGEEQLFDRTLVDTFGRTRHTQAHYVPEFVEGEVSGFFVLVADVTARVEAQRELAEVQRLARVGSWTEHRVTGEMAWSDETYRIFGLPADTPPSREAVLDLIHPEDRERALAVAQSGIEAAADTESHFRVVRPDGAVVFVHARTTVVVRDGRVVARRGTLVDETESQEAAARLAEVNARLSDVLSMVGHDVRTPVTAIRGFLELAEIVLQGDEPGQALGHVRRALEASHRLTDLLSDVLSMAQLESANPHEDRRSVAVVDLVRLVLADFSEETGVVVDVPPGLRVLATPAHVRLVLSNLVLNAMKYGAPPITVSAAPAADRMVEIRVTDRGEGVPEQFRPLLFDRGSRAEAGPAPGNPGTGLGLYIVSRLTTANGGSVHHEVGEDGRGAVFVVCLPSS